MFVFDDDACDDDDDVEEAPVFMVRLKNEMDALDELLNEDVEDSAANTQDLAAKTARFAALLNMMRYLNQSIKFCGDTTRA